MTARSTMRGITSMEESRDSQSGQTLHEMHICSKLPLVDGVPLGSVKESDLLPIEARGIRCYSTKALYETTIARVIGGEIDLKNLPDDRVRARHCAEKAGHTKVLIKVIDKQYVTPAFVTKILPHDLQNICRLAFHPSIALPYDSFQSHASVYLVSEQTTGLDVVSYMRRHGNRENEARPVFGQILSGFAYAHSQGVVHRDLKPACVVVDENGKVKIHDFGLSPKLSVIQRAQLHETTKRAYMAPEVVKSRRYESKEADIYSLGILLYEMLHGCVPYVGQRMEVLKQIRLRALKFYPRISKEAKNLIKETLHPDPWRRPTVAQCEADPWSRGVHVTAPPPKVPKAQHNAGDMSSTWKHPARKIYTQATVKCGNEHVMLRSRIPDRNTAYAMDVDFPEMCMKLQPKRKSNLPKPATANRSNPVYTAVHSDTQMPRSRDVKPCRERLRSAEQLSQVDSIRSTLCVTSIPKPEVPHVHQQPVDAVSELAGLNAGEVFGSRPASACSSVSVMAFNHAESEFSYDECDYESLQNAPQNVAKRLCTPGVKKQQQTDGKVQQEMPPLVFNTPVTQNDEEFSDWSSQPHSQPRSENMIQHPIHRLEDYDNISSDDGGDDLSASMGSITSHAIDQKTAEEETVVEDIEETASKEEGLIVASFKSDRATPVPSDLGSLEPLMGFQPRRRTRLHCAEEVNLHEVMQLPCITNEEHVNQFLSTVPYDDTLPEPKPAPKVPAPPLRHATTSAPINTFIGRRIPRPSNFAHWRPVLHNSQGAIVGYLPPIKGEAIGMGSTIIYTVERQEFDTDSFTTEGHRSKEASSEVSKLDDLPTSGPTECTQSQPNSAETKTIVKDTAEHEPAEDCQPGPTTSKDVANTPHGSKLIKNCSQIHKLLTSAQGEASEAGSNLPKPEHPLLPDNISDFSTQVQPSLNEPTNTVCPPSTKCVDTKKLITLNRPVHTCYPSHRAPAEVPRQRCGGFGKVDNPEINRSQLTRRNRLSGDEIPILKGIKLQKPAQHIKAASRGEPAVKTDTDDVVAPVKCKQQVQQEMRVAIRRGHRREKTIVPKPVLSMTTHAKEKYSTLINVKLQHSSKTVYPSKQISCHPKRRQGFVLPVVKGDTLVY